VQDWVQLNEEKWIRISRKRQIADLDFSPPRLLTEGLRVRVLPGHSDDEKPYGADDGVAPNA